MTDEIVTMFPVSVQETWVDRLYHRLFGRPKSLEDRIADAMEAERLLAEATVSSMRRQQFDLHMSLSRIQALENWNHNRVMTELPKETP